MVLRLRSPRMRLVALISALALSLVTIFIVVSATAAKASTESPTIDEWHSWYTTALNDNPQNSHDVTWPQSYAGAGKVAPKCGETIQQDHMYGTREQLDAVLEDGRLSGDADHPEDAGLTREWDIVIGPVCEEVKPVITEDVTSSTDCTGLTVTITRTYTDGVMTKEARDSVMDESQATCTSVEMG